MIFDALWLRNSSNSVYLFELVASILGHEAGSSNTRILARHYIRTDLVDRKRVALEAWDKRLVEIIEGKLTSTNVVQLSDLLQNAV